jgi:hypothetical protein
MIDRWDMDMPELERRDAYTHETDPNVLYARWVTACGQLRDAYQRWCEAGTDTSAGYYAAVTAMMDQEATAAAVYARALAKRPHGLDLMSPAQETIASAFAVQSSNTASPAAKSCASALAARSSLSTPESSVRRAG